MGLTTSTSNKHTRVGQCEDPPPSPVPLPNVGHAPNVAAGFGSAQGRRLSRQRDIFPLEVPSVVPPTDLLGFYRLARLPGRVTAAVADVASN